MIKYTNLFATVLLAALVALPVLSSAQSTAGTPEDMGMPYGTLPDPIELTDRDVTGFIKLASELQQLGVEFDAETMGQSPSTLQALQGRQRAMDILNSADFDLERLQSVGYSVALAIAALDQDMDEMQQQMAQMEAMKSQMTPEQWAMMSAGMGMAVKMMEQMQNQPAGNIELVRKHRAELDQLLD
jgi:hypothetical protein